uniref:Uncharacterized protein n=1 Tax=Moniliophthora roreri TaxID=221103 RepID=A0A0W0FQA0_MONRR
MPPPADPQAMSEYPDPLSFSLIDRLGRRTDGNGYPHPNINDTCSLITRLTLEPRTLEEQLTPSLAPALCMATEPPVNDTLVYPDPTPDPNIKPKVELTNDTPTQNLAPPITANPRSLQTPEASVPPASVPP